MPIIRPLFPGNKFPTNNGTQLPDTLMDYSGAWATDTSYENRDVVAEWGAYWVWNNTTPSVAGTRPGVGTNNWWQLSGIANMDNFEAAAWTNPHTGNLWWSIDDLALFTRASSSWKLVGPTPSPLSYATSGARASGIGAGAGVWTTLVSLTMSNVPQGKYLCTGALVGATSAALNGNTRFYTHTTDASPSSPFASANDGTTRLLSVVTWVYTMPATGNITVNLQVNPNITGLSVATGTQASFAYVGR